MTPTLTFLGAAETVTGSRYLLETDDARVLVDCGLFQGFKNLRERNWRALPFDPATLDAVVLTHAHIDHSGYVPKLCKAGFAGKIHCTRGTRALLELLLPDSGYLQEEDAKRANKYGYTRHRPAEPLYTVEDAERSLKALVAESYHELVEVAPGVSVTFTPAGHIIGAACVEVRVGAQTVAFTGDVGRSLDPIMKPPEPLGRADFLITESTYGDRRHPTDDVTDILQRIVTETAGKHGVLLIPAFAVGRAQHVLKLLADLKETGRIPDLPVFLDSPMAIDATSIFCEHREDHRLSDEQCRKVFHAAHCTRTPEDSKGIDRRGEAMIVISASGMATGGRVLHHLKRFVPEERNTVLFVGFQAAGTRGRALVDGADELKIHGQYIPVRASVHQIQGLSAHADYREMLDWLAMGRLSPRRVFVTHGEPAAADAFRRRLHDTFAWDVVVPEDGSTWPLE